MGRLIKTGMIPPNFFLSTTFIDFRIAKLALSHCPVALSYL